MDDSVLNFINDKEIPDQLKSNLILAAMKMKCAKNLADVKSSLLCMIDAIEIIEKLPKNDTH